MIQQATRLAEQAAMPRASFMRVQATLATESPLQLLDTKRFKEVFALSRGSVQAPSVQSPLIRGNHRFTSFY